MVLAGAGGVEHDRLVELADKYFGIVDKGSNDVLYYEAGKFCEAYVSGKLRYGFIICCGLESYSKRRHGSCVWLFSCGRNQLDPSRQSCYASPQYGSLQFSLRF